MKNISKKCAGIAGVAVGGREPSKYTWWNVAIVHFAGMCPRSGGPSINWAIVVCLL